MMKDDLEDFLFFVSPKRMEARHCMSHSPVTVQRHQSLEVVEKRFVQTGFPQIVVVDEHNACLSFSSSPLCLSKEKQRQSPSHRSHLLQDLGVVDRNIVARAIIHGFSGHSVEIFSEKKGVHVLPNAPIAFISGLSLGLSLLTSLS